MKHLIILSFVLIFSGQGFGQDVQVITIDTCYNLARRNYPLLKQHALLDKTAAFTIDNASKGYLPQIAISGQASYQSEVTKIPISMPGVNITELSKDQYRVYAEINQSLTDPLVIKQQKELINTTAVVEKEKLEVELYKLKERINQLYFGILIIDAQLQQLTMLQKDLALGIQKTNAALANGISLKSSVDLLEAEMIKLVQKETELKYSRKAYISVLSLFIKRDIDEKEILQVPKYEASNQPINRPELKLLAIQKKSFDIQNQLLLSKNLPRVSLFLQGGYGRPTLNMLNNDFGTYYIGGARFSWNFTGFYTYKKEKQIQILNQNGLEVQKDMFLFNTSIMLKQQQQEINKLEELLKSDHEIIALRERIKNTTGKQLESGTATTIDYLNALNAEDQARQNLAIHNIQLLMAQYQVKTTTGN